MALSKGFAPWGALRRCSCVCFRRSARCALAVAGDIFTACGADSPAGRTAAVMLGSTETTFYVLSVYFGAAGVRKTRHVVPAALCADLAGFLAAAFCVNVLHL